ncbi:hypothetical protein ACJJTC_000051 [Scirpophaga incertulas]
MVVKAWIRRMSEGGDDEEEAAGAPVRRWPAGILRRSGARAARRMLHVKYRSVPPLAPPAALPLDLDDTVSCFCRKARRKEREGEPTGDPKLYLQEALLERKLPDVDLRQLVELPHGLDYNEWLASHTLALFEHVNLLYGTVSEFCTAAGCPDMAGPGGPRLRVARRARQEGAPRRAAVRRLRHDLHAEDHQRRDHIPH